MSGVELSALKASYEFAMAFVNLFKVKSEEYGVFIFKRKLSFTIKFDLGIGNIFDKIQRRDTRVNNSFVKPFW